LYARDLFDALGLLLAKKLLIEGRSLLRTFYRALVELMYMSAEPAERAHQLTTFYHAQNKRVQEKAREFGGDPGNSRRQGKVDREYQSVKRLRRDRKGQP